ncbi:MAG: type IV pili twitching motility protein PilT, partial [Dolichospermum sp.]
MPSLQLSNSSSYPRQKPSEITLAHLIQEAFDGGYSDIHLTVGEIPRFRDRGEMQITNYPETDKATFTSWLYEILGDEEIESFQKNLEFDGAVQYDFVRVRINIFDSLRGNGMVLRLIPLQIMSIEQLRLPPII